MVTIVGWIIVIFVLVAVYGAYRCIVDEFCSDDEEDYDFFVTDEDDKK